MAKGKGISSIEQHIEKIVLGVVGAVFLGVVAVQFVGGATKVTVDNRDLTLTPDAAMAHIGRKAVALIAQVNDASPEFPQVPALGIEQAWREGFSTDKPVQVAQLMRSVGPDAGERAPDENDVEPTGDYKYPQLVIGGPAKPMAVSFHSTVDPYQVASSPEVRAIVPVSQPFDISAISVEATFDAEALRATLSEDPDGDSPGFSSIPSQWWRDNIEILEVHLERADALDDSGDPINLTLVGTLPGQETLMDLMEFDPENMTMDDADDLVGVAREEAGLVREPRFYRSIAGAAWMSPSDFAKLDEIDARQSDIRRLVQRYKGFEEELVRLDGRLAEAGVQRDTGGGGGLSHSPGSDPRDRQRDRNRPVNPQVALIERQIDQVTLRQQRVKLDLEDLGVDETGEPMVGDDEQEFKDPLLDADTVTILAHDVTIEPGMSYIYRMRIVVNNPLFGHGQQLHEEQRQLASDPTIVGEWSAWSDPIGVLSDQYFFVTNASEAGLIGGPNAVVEVYKFWYGYWRKGNVNIEPGDVISTELKLPDANLLPIFDMAQIASAVDSRRGNRRRGDPLGGGGHLDFDQPIGRDLTDEDLPEFATPAEPLAPVRVDYVLLDVATVAGSEGGERSQAIFRGLGGQVVTRLPRADKALALYERVKASAAEGMRQGRPEPEPEPVDNFIPPDRQPIRQPDAPKGPGGG